MPLIITDFQSEEQLQEVVDICEDFTDLLEPSERTMFENVSSHFKVGNDFAIATNYTHQGGGLFWTANFKSEDAPDGFRVVTALEYIESETH